MRQTGIIVLLLIIWSLSSYTIPPRVQLEEKRRGEVIGFDMFKCGCCWGWIIKVDSDTIMADKLPNKSIPSKFEEPFPVDIVVGKKQDRCFRKYPYFEIKYIQQVE